MRSCVVGFLDLVWFDVSWVVGCASDKILDEIAAVFDLLQLFLGQKRFGVSALIEKKLDDLAIAIGDREKDRGASLVIHISTIFDSFDGVIRGTNGAGKFESAVRNGITHSGGGLSSFKYGN